MATSRRAAATYPAYVLHRYDWSETSLILDLFIRDMGRVAVAAKGAKRPYSQLRPVLLPFQRLHVAFGKSSNTEDPAEVQTLRHAEWAGGAPMLLGGSLFSGFYLNELLMKLLARHDPHPALFDVYASTLAGVAAGGDSEESALRAFELVLLREMGVLPDLGVVTLTAEEPQPRRYYAMRPEAGLIALATLDEGGCSGAGWIGLQAALEHGSLAALQAACAPIAGALKPQLRALLHYHLGSPHMRTREVMLDVQRLLDTAPIR